MKGHTPVRMRILIAAGIFPPEVGGPATYAHILMKELPKIGMDVAVVPFRDVRKYPNIIRHLAYMWRLYAEAKNADVVFAQDPVSVGVPALIVSVLRRKTFVVRIAGDYAWEQAVQRFGVRELLDEFIRSNRWYGFPVALMRSLERMAARRASRVIVPSTYFKRIMEAWGVDPKRISVVYNTFESRIAVHEDKEMLRAMYDLKDPVIFSSARLVPWKGMDTLIRLLPEIPGAALHIAGDGPERDALLHVAEQTGVSDRVVFLGALPQEELFRRIKASDVFVLNTGYEGFSHQILEAMAIGVPVVTTNVGGNAELVENHVQGILVHYNNRVELLGAIRAVLEGHHDAFVEKARQKSSEFTIQRMILGTVDALTNV